MIKLKKLLAETGVLNEKVHGKRAWHFKTKAALDKAVKENWKDFVEYVIPTSFDQALFNFDNPYKPALKTWEDSETELHPVFMEWLRDNFSFVGSPPVGEELYDLYERLVDVIKKNPDAVLDDDGDKKGNPEFIDIKNRMLRLAYDIAGPRANRIYDLFSNPKYYDEVKAHFKKAGGGGGGEPMYLGFNHIKGGYAELPEELLNALPNKAQITQQMDKINSGDTDLNPSDPMLYKYDQLLTKGLIDLMKKNGAKITKKDIEMEDDYVSISASVKPASVSALEKLGFEKDE